MRRCHLLGEVTPSLVRHGCVDNIAVHHRLVEQLVCDLAERERPRQPHPRSVELAVHIVERTVAGESEVMGGARGDRPEALHVVRHRDRKSTRLNSSHGYISYAVFCLKKKKKIAETTLLTRSST